MKKILMIISVLCLSAKAISQTSSTINPLTMMKLNSMEITEMIKQAITDFVKGGDNNDVGLLEKVLHPKFQNIQDGFFAEKGIYAFSKSEYIELVINKTFGGKPRTIQFVAVEQLGNIAIAKVVLESKHLKFYSTIICVCTDGNWQVINNTPTIEVLQ